MKETAVPCGYPEESEHTEVGPRKMRNPGEKPTSSLPVPADKDDDATVSISTPEPIDGGHKDDVKQKKRTFEQASAGGHEEAVRVAGSPTDVREALVGTMIDPVLGGDYMDNSEQSIDTPESCAASTQGHNEQAAGLVAIVGNSLNGSMVEEEEKLAPLESLQCGPLKWNDTEQIEYRDVPRYPIDHPDTPKLVRHARMDGQPVVLCGHCSWTNFAKEWMVPEPSESDLTNEPTDGGVHTEFNLAKSRYRVNTEKIIEEMGDRHIPVLRKSYNEYKPINHTLPLKVFLKKYWCPEQSKTAASTGTTEKLYLHQWQLNQTPSIKERLQSADSQRLFPNGILGEDMLQHWLDAGVNPFQYIFMGGQDTMSRLHKDNGGLDILILPFVGQKECVMVHRDDGERNLYALDAKLEEDEIDLSTFPLSAFVRVWKTVIQPGEILLMPGDTYHQCRNLTPCLSLSRFHLDDISLKFFLESLENDDSKEIDHDDIIWNYATVLMKRIDGYFDQHSDPGGELPGDVVRDIVVLRKLRHACRRILDCFEMHRRGRPSPKRQASYNRSTNKLPPNHSVFSEKREQMPLWKKLLDDIDKSLHDYRFGGNIHSPDYDWTRRYSSKRQRVFIESEGRGAETEALLNSEGREFMDDEIGHVPKGGRGRPRKRQGK